MASEDEGIHCEESAGPPARQRAIRVRREVVVGLAVLFCCVYVMAPWRSRPVRIAAKATSVVLKTEDPNLEPPGIVLHDSDTPGRMRGRLVGCAQIEAIERTDHPNWRTVCNGKVYHIGYHYVVRTDGVVEKGRPDDCLGTHCRTHNDWLGICVVGGFSTNRHWWPNRPTHRQMVSLIALCERLMSRYHISPTYVKRHRDLNQTWCPGDRFPYRFLMRVLKKYAQSHPETRTPPGRMVSLAIPKRGERRVYPRFLEGVSTGDVTHRTAAAPLN